MGRGEKASSFPSHHSLLALYAHSHHPPIALFPSSRGPTEPWEACGGCSNFISTSYRTPPPLPPPKKKRKTKITWDKKINHNICIYILIHVPLVLTNKNLLQKAQAQFAVSFYYNNPNNLGLAKSETGSTNSAKVLDRTVPPWRAIFHDSDSVELFWIKTKFQLDWSLVLRLVKHVYIMESGSNVLNCHTHLSYTVLKLCVFCITFSSWETWRRWLSKSTLLSSTMI